MKERCVPIHVFMFSRLFTQIVVSYSFDISATVNHDHLWQYMINVNPID